MMSRSRPSTSRRVLPCRLPTRRARTPRALASATRVSPSGRAETSQLLATWALSTAGVVAALALGAARSAAEEPAANPANAPAVASAGATAAPGPSTASGSQGATVGTPASPPESTAPDSTSKDPAAPPQTPVESARLAYGHARAQRAAGDFD